MVDYEIVRLIIDFAELVLVAVALGLSQKITIDNKFNASMVFTKS